MRAGPRRWRIRIVDDRDGRRSGGPGGRGMTPGLWMYNRAFIAGEFGYACAVGMILFVFILALTLINNRFVRVEK